MYTYDFIGTDGIADEHGANHFGIIGDDNDDSNDDDLIEERDKDYANDHDLIEDREKGNVIISDDEASELGVASGHKDGEVVMSGCASMIEISDTWRCQKCSLINTNGLGSLLEGVSRKERKFDGVACTACSLPRWEMGKDENDADLDYMCFPGMYVSDQEETIDESEMADDPEEVKGEVRACVYECTHTHVCGCVYVGEGVGCSTTHGVVNVSHVCVCMHACLLVCG